MTQPTFSAVVVAQNEREHIRSCFESLRWCQERILVDMQSQDDTCEQARDLATMILLQEPIPHMEFARNRGIDAATGEWILVVDADEIIPDRLAARLQQHAAATATDGIWLPRMYYCFGQPVPHVGGFPDFQLRAFRRERGRYPDRLHAAPTIHGQTMFLPIEDGVWILHQRKNAGIGHLVPKWDVYAAKEARIQIQQGRGFPGPVAMIWAAVSAFRFRFFTQRGYRDGMAGLVLSVLFAFYRFEVEAKLWEAGGCGAMWNRDVGRLRSTPHLLCALGVHLARRLWRRTFGHTGNRHGS
jgi:glycosyltransferase involved in cell wall biosynthesis